MKAALLKFFPGGWMKDIRQPKTTRVSWLSLGFAALAALTGAGTALAVSSFLGPVASAAAVLGLIVAALTIMRPDLGLLAFIFITYTRLSDVAIEYHGAPSIAKPFVALLALAILVRWVLYQEQPKGWLRPAVLMGIYGMVIFTSLLYASDFWMAREALSDFVKDAIITVIVVILLQNIANLRRAIWVLLLAGIFMGTISVYQYMTGAWDNTFWGFGQAPVLNLIGTTEGARLGGPIGDPNFYAQIMLVIVPLAMLRAAAEKSMPLRLLALWAFGVCILTAVFTYSRGAFVALLVMLVAIVIYRPPRPVEIGILLLAGVALLRFVPDTYMTRILSVADLFSGQSDVRSEVSFRGRASELLVGMYMFADHPVLGVGVGNYPTLYQQYSRQIGYDPRTEAREPHNLYLEVASENGMAGLLIFGAILWSVFSSLQNARTAFRDAGLHTEADMVASLSIAMTGYLSAAFFIHGAYPRFFYLLIGIALSLPQIVQNTLAHDAPGRQPALLKRND